MDKKKGARFTWLTNIKANREVLHGTGGQGPTTSWKKGSLLVQ